MYNNLKSIGSKQIKLLDKDIKRESDEFTISFQKLRVLLGVIGVLFPLLLFFSLAIYQGFLKKDLIFLSSFGVVALYLFSFYYFERVRRYIGINYMFAGLVVLFLIYFILTITNENICNIPSISDYFHTTVSTLFIAVLVAISVFLYTYNGESYTEEKLCSWASLFCLGIAFFPTNQKTNIINKGDNINTDIFYSCLEPGIQNHPIIGWLHLICAGIFFFLLSKLILNHFLKREEELDFESEGKRKRILMYKICGRGIRYMLILIVVYFILEQFIEAIQNWPLVFILELFALWFFGFAWLVKGEFILWRNSYLLKIEDE